MDWNAVSDGGLWRLKRGRDYGAGPEAVVREAKLRAEGVGKHACTTIDRMGRWEYVWVQFLDGQLGLGEPCGGCGGGAIERLQEYFLRCASCGAVHALVATDTSDDPDGTEVAEISGARMLSVEGVEIGELTLDDAAIVEATCRFHRAVSSVQLHFAFRRGRLKALRTSCPDAIDVSSPQTVRFSVRLAPRVLPAGDYRVTPSIGMVVEDEPRWPLRVSRWDAFWFRLIDRRPGEPHWPPRPGQPPLDWTVSVRADNGG